MKSKLPEKVAGKIKLLALESAADKMEADEDEDVEKVDKSMETCTCPECGHEGPVTKFKD